MRLTQIEAWGGARFQHRSVTGWRLEQEDPIRRRKNLGFAHYLERAATHASKSAQETDRDVGSIRKTPGATRIKRHLRDPPDLFRPTPLAGNEADLCWKNSHHGIEELRVRVLTL
ncbi:hypothetical protein FOCG_09515 [Fusarium oxysporum f. sp. radicis-lycopersici 26381]|uniref:Uncharacterized protein n=1 Tax=Fusarium oxysporum Fo47 TaxID=660027 RepID=W9L4M7_FUSOX|nr:hypothetical protein FOZG_00712 [Fusarium oxysporum Fo47]EWZ88582.1 hypothetical protein FOWG_08507 [Fusarium oxysporum f. sp. lycopersici MN25]EXL48939.1 hypothetical protein FOCG_09515 [Fusarium oxysporum f. sp. radicis-lycopersici 26381]